MEEPPPGCSPRPASGCNVAGSGRHEARRRGPSRVEAQLAEAGVGARRTVPGYRETVPGWPVEAVHAAAAPARRFGAGCPRAPRPPPPRASGVQVALGSRGEARLVLRRAEVVGLGLVDELGRGRPI